MSDYLTGDPKWDDDEQPVSGAGGSTRFAKARLYHPLYVNRFQGGEHFTLPGVYYDKYDETTKATERVGLKEFRGMTLSDKPTKFYLALVVLEMKNKDGQWYQRQIQFNNWQDKGDDGNPQGCAWLQFQKDEMKKLSPADRNALIEAAKNQKWVYVRYAETETGYTGQYEIKKYLSDIAVFKNEQEWAEAEKAFRAQFGENGTAASPYPDGWIKSGLETMLNYVKTNPDLDRSNHKAFAVNIGLLDENGQPAKTPDDKPCDVAKILSEVLNIPEPMIKL